MTDFSLRVDLALNGSVHTVTVPTDGQEDALQLQDIMQLHLETLQAGNTCEDTEWLHMMLVQRDVLCPCLHDCFDTAHILTYRARSSATDHAGTRKLSTAHGAWYPSSPVSTGTAPTGGSAPRRAARCAKGVGIHS